MKQLLFALSFLFTFCISYSQDIITQKNGEEIEVKIIGVSDQTVTYYFYEDPDKVEVTMNRSLIREIEYEYGRKEEEIQPGLEASYFVDDKINNVLVNFSGLASYTGMVSYERGLSPVSSIGGGIKIHGVGAPTSYTDNKSGFGIEANYKVKTGNIFKKSDYRPQHFLQGFYLRPDIGFTTAEFTDDPGTIYEDDYEKYTYFYGGFDIGNQWIFNNTLSLDLYTGLNFFGGDYEYFSNGELDTEYYWISDGNMVGESSTALRYGLQIGFIFN